MTATPNFTIPTADGIDKEAVLARLNEPMAQAIYQSIGVTTFKSNGPDNWIVFCPWRDNHNTPALSIRKADGVWHDMATDDGGDIINAVMRAKGLDFLDALELIAGIVGCPPTSKDDHGSTGKRIVKTYDYLDERGNLLHQTVRYEPKDFSQRRPNGQGGWTWNLRGIELVLYRLPELIAADPSRWVLLCEGEKDADRLAALGFISTTNVMGAKKWRVSYAETLRGRNVAILPDNDHAGVEHVQKLTAALSGVAATIKVVELPGLGPRVPSHGKDVSDWLDAGGTKDGLKRLILEAPAWEPTADEPEEPSTPEPKRWPNPPNQAALYGLAGDIVRALDKETEADQIAVLVSLLTAVGNIIDAGPHWSVSGSDHALRLFPVLVGPTSKGRKGTAWSALKPLLKWAAPDWYEGHISAGLSSGEGLIWAVRDKIVKTEPVKDHGRVVDYQEVEVDPGITDKRLLVIEEEFASVLKLMGREGNILSAVVRQAWDSGDLRTLTKTSPARATQAHISILGHITQDELLRYLDSTEAANGFGNRLLWICVKRSKLLPDGGEVDERTLIDLAGRLREVFEFAKKVDLIQRDDEAAVRWRQVYGRLSEGGVGLLGALTSRAEAQVMRLAAIYAILDRSDLIRLPHLEAALALWQYIDASADYIFGDTLGDSVADTILAALRQSGPMTRNEIVNLFQRNQRRSRIEKALSDLATAGRIRSSKDTSTGGRPAEVWTAVN